MIASVRDLPDRDSTLYERAVMSPGAPDADMKVRLAGESARPLYSCHLFTSF